MPHPLPAVDARHGAPMGRPSTFPKTETKRFYLSRVRINQGGYDSGGAYWGIGQPLFQACAADGDACFYFRVSDRSAAKNHILEQYPQATFFH